MFSLIITIISIVLVGLLAVATIYYGGEAFSNRGDEARANRILNEGQQLAGASVLADNDGVLQATAGQYTVAELSPEYVNGAFTGWTPVAGGFRYGNTAGTATEGICAAITAKIGTSDKITVAPNALVPGSCLIDYRF